MSTCFAGLDEPHGDSVRSPPEAEALGRALAAPCRLARLRRRVTWTPSAGSPDDSGSGVQPGARQPDCRLRQIQFALGISRSVCRSVRRLSVCCIDRVNCCPDQGDWEPFFSGTTPAAKKIALPDNGQKSIIQAPAASGLAKPASAKVTAVHVTWPTQARVP
jgi:hypothetical protein